MTVYCYTCGKNVELRVDGPLKLCSECFPAPSKPPRDEYDQPLPAEGNQHPAIQPLVLQDLQARAEVGRKRYGQYLYPFNGRDMLRDYYEELLDACVYARALLYERDGK